MNVSDMSQVTRVVWTMVVTVGLLSHGPAWAATLTVDTNLPGINNDSLCSFAEAIENADGGAVHDDCAPGEPGVDVIELGVDETYPQPEGTEYWLHDIILNGNGSTFTADRYRWDGIKTRDCVFNDLTISNAEPYENVGRAAVTVRDGRLTLNRCALVDNIGGVHVVGSTLVAIESRISLSSNVGIMIDDSLENSSSVMALDCDFHVQNWAIKSWEAAHVSVVQCDFTGHDGIYLGQNRGGSLRIRDSSFIGLSNAVNSMVDDFGMDGCYIGTTLGGIEVSSGIISNSTFFDNQRAVRVNLDEDDSEVTVQSSTFVKNWNAAIEILNDHTEDPLGIVHVWDTTIADNNYGLEGPADLFELRNNIICASWDENCSGDYRLSVPTSLGFNIVDDISCLLNHPTDSIVDDAMLSGLDDYGGKTPVLMPLPGSPATDNVDWPDLCAQIPFDQRGFRRPVDGNNDGIARCDSGAVEAGAEPPPHWPPVAPADPRMTASED